MSMGFAGRFAERLAPREAGEPYERVRLALLAGVMPERLVAALVVVGIDVTADQAFEVAMAMEHLMIGPAAAFEHLIAANAAVPVAVAAAAAPPTEALVVDPALGELPLLELAADLAPAQPGGVLQIVAVDLAGPTAGMYVRTASAGVICVHPGRMDRAAVVAHELAHALDPRLDEVSRDDQERFAEALAELLLEHRPATVVAARPLIDEAERACGWRRSVPAYGDLAGVVSSALDDVVFGRATPSAAASPISSPGEGLPASAGPQQRESTSTRRTPERQPAAAGSRELEEVAEWATA